MDKSDIDKLNKEEKLYKEEAEENRRNQIDHRLNILERWKDEMTVDLVDRLME